MDQSVAIFFSSQILNYLHNRYWKCIALRLYYVGTVDFAIADCLVALDSTEQIDSESDELFMPQASMTG